MGVRKLFQRPQTNREIDEFLSKIEKQPASTPLLLVWMELPSYFVLDGIRAYTSFEGPEDIYFTGQVKPKGYPSGSVINVVSVQPLEPPHIFTTTLPKKNIPVYKSNLQKCVRRRLADRAIRTAYAMMSADAPDLLRRIPIIMIEDVLPHPSLVPLIWWMMATTKGYQLSDAEVSHILGVVYMMCQIPEYQVKNAECKPEGELPDWSGLPTTQKDLMWALEFRKVYRGMACDVEMIEYLQRRWYIRFTAPKPTPLWKMLTQISVEPVDLESLGVCDKDDLILEAIDQHCFRWIPKKLAAKFPDIPEYEIKGAIWFYRSRINYRKVCHDSKPLKYIPALEHVYLTIKGDLEGLCLWIFNNLI